MRLEGKVALITGASGGMGSASARLFAKEGASVLVAARHKELADSIVKEITDAGGRLPSSHWRSPRKTSGRRRFWRPRSATGPCTS